VCFGRVIRKGTLLSNSRFAFSEFSRKPDFYTSYRNGCIIFTVYYYNTVLIGFPLLFIRCIYLLGCDSSGGMSPVHMLLICTRLPLSKQDILASMLKAIKARPCIL
jgi:hypothetical protein